MRIFQHVIVIVVSAAVLIGIPFAAFADVDAIASVASGVDTISSATEIQEAPSGRYTIIINREKHSNADVLANWVTFFSGDDVPLIMEDIECVALEGDLAGIDMAESLQSRLPENQMSVKAENPVLALSKADAGLFDVLVMSDEAASAYSADTVTQARDVEVVHR